MAVAVVRWAEQYKKETPEVSVTVSGGGTGTGIAALINGAVDVAWKKTIAEKELQYSGDVRAYLMPSERSIDINTELDFALAELLIKRRRP